MTQDWQTWWKSWIESAAPSENIPEDPYSHHYWTRWAEASRAWWEWWVVAATAPWLRQPWPGHWPAARVGNAPVGSDDVVQPVAYPASAPNAHRPEPSESAGVPRANRKTRHEPPKTLEPVRSAGKGSHRARGLTRRKINPGG